MNATKWKTRQITLTAVLAAVYFVLRSIPTFQMVGVSGRFTAGDFVLTAIALTVDLWSAAFAVIIGTALAYAINPPIFFGLDFLPALVNVAIAGLILSNHRRVALAVYVSVLAAFLASPYSLLFAYSYVPYAWLHLVALIILSSPIAPRVSKWLVGDGLRQLVAVAVLALLGTMAQHLAGSLLSEFTVGLVGGVSPSSFEQFWRVIFWLYPVERTVLLAMSTLVAVALFRATRRLGLPREGIAA
jgi:hypothetical protein